MLMVTALMRGVSNGMVRNAVSTLTGEIQIHAKGFRSDPVIEHSITDMAQVDVQWGGHLKILGSLSWQDDASL